MQVPWHTRRVSIMQSHKTGKRHVSNGMLHTHCISVTAVVPRTPTKMLSRN